MSYKNLNRRLDELEGKIAPPVAKPVYLMIEGQDPYPEDPSRYRHIICYQIVETREDFERLKAESLTDGELK